MKAPVPNEHLMSGSCLSHGAALSYIRTMPHARLWFFHLNSSQPQPYEVVVISPIYSWNWGMEIELGCWNCAASCEGLYIQILICPTLQLVFFAKHFRNSAFWEDSSQMPWHQGTCAGPAESTGSWKWHCLQLIITPCGAGPTLYRSSQFALGKCIFRRFVDFLLGPMGLGSSYELFLRRHPPSLCLLPKGLLQGKPMMAEGSLLNTWHQTAESLK